MQMELSLNEQYVNYFETVFTHNLAHEETMETIVPDAKPDIVSIINTEGQVYIKAKQAQAGRLELAGVIRVNAIYRPEGEGALQQLEVDIPFTVSAEDAAIAANTRLVVEPTVLRAETRLLNPRKVMLRAEISVSVRAFLPRSKALCAQVEVLEEVGLQQKSVTETVYLVTAVEETVFSLSEDLSIPGNRPAAQCVLKQRVCLLSGEEKIIGNKLVFKGELQLQLLYLSVDGGLECISFNLPFSQIMEISGVGEDAETTLCIYGSDCNCRIGFEEGRTVQFNISLLAQATIREKRSYQLLSDLYSTRYLLEAEREEHCFHRQLELAERVQSVREIMETEQLPLNVLDSYAIITPIMQSREGAQLTLTCAVMAHVLFQAEDSALYQGSASYEVPLTIDAGAESVCYASARIAGELSAVPVSGGIEVRIPVSFSYETVEENMVSCITNIRLASERVKDGQCPSIVLRTVNQESLWEIAKSYGITGADIMQANDLSCEEDMAGRVLLIPQKG